MAAITLGQTAPLEVRRGASLVARIWPERDGDGVEFDAVGVEVLNSAGTVVQSGSADVAAGSASFEIEGATTADVDLDSDGQGWEVIWTCELAGEDQDLVHREPLDVVLYTPQPQVTWSMLTARHPDLAARMNATSAQAQIEEAWARLLGELRGKGKRSTLIVDSVALREPHALLTLAMIWRGLATGGPSSTEWAHADRYDDAFSARWATTTFESADPSTWRRTGTREGVGGAIDMSGAGRSRYRTSGYGFV